MYLFSSGFVDSVLLVYYIVFVRKLCFLRKKYMHCTDSVCLERGITVFSLCCFLVFHESLTMNGGIFDRGGSMCRKFEFTRKTMCVQMCSTVVCIYIDTF